MSTQKKQSGATQARRRLAALLHGKPQGAPYDNSRIWGGDLKIAVDGGERNPTMCRIFLNPANGETRRVRITAALFARGVTDQQPMEPGDVDARVWLDFNDHGFHDERGMHHPPLPRYEPMHLHPVPDNSAHKNGSVLFESEELIINTTGVFHFTVGFSADALAFHDPAKQWVTVNQLSHNRDGVVVVSPRTVEKCPSIAEVCLRKYGAAIVDDEFRSGGIRKLTDDIENIPADVIYLLPFFQPGTGDLFTDQDVRKGSLGSVYAVKHFFRIDPDLITPPEQADIPGLVSLGLITERDLSELLTGEQHDTLRSVNEIAARTTGELIEILGRDVLVQLLGRAEMRWLVDKAHGLDKRIIFDLVLMQTSRDCPLIRNHLDWYALDEEGQPKRHKIAWLDYSDVALFDLKFNKPLQNYLSSVAPYWISVCGFDGVRIDAAQTVDRPFLKQIKNRINAVKPDALVLGETLCAMEEAVDVATDMIYTLLVDHHVHTTNAGSYFDLFEEIHARFSPNTVGMAYFENHDSGRATRAWHEQFHEHMQAEPALFHYWASQAMKALPAESLKIPWDTAYYPALLKNILCSVINCTAGTRDRVRLAYAFEMGTDYGEEQRTDFENGTVLYPHLRGEAPHRYLHAAYESLADLKRSHDLLSNGRVWYLRNDHPAADLADKIMAWAKYDDSRAMAVACNLDVSSAHSGAYPLLFPGLDPDKTYDISVVFDSYSLMNALHQVKIRSQYPGLELRTKGLALLLPPLCALILDIVPHDA